MTGPLQPIRSETGKTPDSVMVAAGPASPNQGAREQPSVGRETCKERR